MAKQLYGMWCPRCKQQTVGTLDTRLCDACYTAQEQDVSQKLPVKVRVLWEVTDRVEREG